MLEEKTDYFVLAYDAPSFSAAAAKVPISPQGFTKIIHNLERSLDVQLFVTDKHGIRRPTPYADELYRYAKQRQLERARLAESFERIKKATPINLRVACAIGIVGLFGPDTFSNFAKVCPDAEITFTEYPDTVCESLVRDGLYDLALTPSPTKTGLQSYELGKTKMMFWVNEANPLSKQNVLEIGDLAGQRIAMPGKEFRCYQRVRAACAEASVEVPDIVEYAEIIWIYRFAAMNKGLGFSLPHLASLDVLDGMNKVPAIPVNGLDWCLSFAWPDTRSLSETEESFRDYIAQRARKVFDRCNAVLAR